MILGGGVVLVDIIVVYLFLVTHNIGEFFSWVFITVGCLFLLMHNIGASSLVYTL